MYSSFPLLIIVVVDNGFGDEAFLLECRKHSHCELCNLVARNFILENAGVHFICLMCTQHSLPWSIERSGLGTKFLCI